MHDKKSNVLFAITLLLLGLVYLNTVTWLFGSWIYNSYYTHGFIVLAISIYLSYKTGRSINPEVDVRGLYVLSSSLLVHVLATLWDFEYISAISLITAIFGLILTLYGANAAKRLSFPVFFMLLAIPLPIYGATNLLEALSAQTSVSLVNLFGIKASNAGAEIHLETCSFVVGAPCSGIRSIISLLTVATLYAYIVRDRLPVKAALVALAVPLAFLANVLRISSILVVAEFSGRDTALGFFHYASDIVLFVTAVIMLMLARRLVGGCLKRLT